MKMYGNCWICNMVVDIEISQEELQVIREDVISTFGLPLTEADNHQCLNLWVNELVKGTLGYMKRIAEEK